MNYLIKQFKKNKVMGTEVALLPDWFQGIVYEEGGVVTNPYSGQEFYLNNLELSMYDFIIGCNMLYELRGSLSDKLIGDMQKGIAWFGETNPEAFYALID